MKTISIVPEYGNKHSLKLVTVCILEFNSDKENKVRVYNFKRDNQFKEIFIVQAIDNIFNIVEQESPDIVVYKTEKGLTEFMEIITFFKYTLIKAGKLVTQKGFNFIGVDYRQLLRNLKMDSWVKKEDISSLILNRVGIPGLPHTYVKYLIFNLIGVNLLVPLMPLFTPKFIISLLNRNKFTHKRRGNSNLKVSKKEIKGE